MRNISIIRLTQYDMGRASEREAIVEQFNEKAKARKAKATTST